MNQTNTQETQENSTDNIIAPEEVAVKKIAAIDLDDCLLDGQSGQLFVQYLNKKKIIPFFFMVKVFVWFILYKTNITNSVESVYVKAVSFSKKIPLARLNELADEFYQTELNDRITDKAKDYIKNLKQRGYELILISNSVEPVVQAVAKNNDISRYFCTKLSVDADAVCTGKIDGELMYGQVKADTLIKLAKDESIDLSKSTALSDHYSDVAMLQLVGEPVAVKPRILLEEFAHEANWPVIYF